MVKRHMRATPFGSVSFFATSLALPIVKPWQLPFFTIRSKIPPSILTISPSNLATAVARYVAALTKDSRLPEEEREAAYCLGLSLAPWQVKVCKLADIYDNLQDSRHLSAAHQVKTQKKARRYLAALRIDLVAPEAIAAWNKVDAFLDQMGSPQPSSKRTKSRT